MIITGSSIRSLNTITHDGKVIAFGTASNGKIYYAVKRSGFEDSAVKPGAEPFGFEDWQPLRLGESAPDASVVAADLACYTDASGTLLLRSVYGSTTEVMTTIDAPVQVVSALGHLCVFRQAPTGKILVSRFVLDGMTNQLVPKLEVRYRRSGQRFTPDPSATAHSGASFDNLDYRDIDGKSFYEPCLELGFVGAIANGWFAPLFVPTVESDRFRWHIFASDPSTGRLCLHSCGAEHSVFFDIKDYLYGLQDPADVENTIYRQIPGLTRRSLDLSGLTIAGAPAVTTYTLQHEQVTDQGPQLIRDAMRVMLAVPVKASGSDVVKTAVLTFGLAKDGGLSQIDLSPDSTTILRSSVSEVITPLTLLDSIKEVATQSPPPAGVIVATERGNEDLLRLRTQGAVPADLKSGAQVKVSGTRSYDGHYKVLSCDGITFQVAATFANNEAGRFEVVPAAPTGLVFDNMIVGGERTSDGKLLIRCPSHDLRVGDEVQISGTQHYNGVFPISAIDDSRAAFTLDAPYFTGEAANLTKVARRGLRMASGDRLETPALDLDAPQHDRDLGRSLSVWVRLDALGTTEQNLIRDGGGLLSLAIGGDNKARLNVRMSDGTTGALTDPNPVVINTWVHFSGALDYSTKSGGDTSLSLCRDGVEVAAQTLPHGLPCQLNDQIINFDGVDDCVELTQNPPSLANRSFSVELWVRRSRIGQEFVFWQGEKLLNAGLHIGFRSNDVFAFATCGNDLNTTVATTDTGWHHYACTYNHLTRTKRAYRDGVLIGQLVCDSHFVGGGVPFIGRFANGQWPFQGNIADVRLWDRVREEGEIRADMNRRLSGREPGLLASWPLDNGTARDLSPAKRHGVLRSGTAFAKALYRYPQAAALAPNVVLDGFTQFDGVKDIVVTPAFATPSTALTIAVWARSSGPNWNNHGCLLSKRNSFLFHPFIGERKVELSITINGVQVSVACTPDNIQIWHHYAATYDGSSACFYLDGVLCGKVAASGPVEADAAGVLCIGHDDGYPALDRNFAGQIADVQVWSCARSQVEIQTSMKQKLRGTEPGLFGWWPLDRDASDRSPSRLHGTLWGAPQALNTRGFTIGGTFTGEIAAAQVWDLTRSPAEVDATMHLQLTGKEPGLIAYYPLGAVAYDQSPPQMPDFSAAAKNAVVYGSPYAGARRLNRQLGGGAKAIKFSSSELCGVSAHGVYQESLEFRVLCSDPAFDPNNADGTGRKLFTFSYWGKSSQGQKDTLPLPPGCIQQSDFQALGGGWYKATCRVVIPDGVRLLRAFELGDLRGRWGEGATPPANEWTAIEVRRHHLRLISDAISREAYTDSTALPMATLQTPALQSSLADMARSEFNVGRTELLIADLNARIDVAQNAARYTAEKTALGTKLTSLKSQRTTTQNERNAIVAAATSYYHRLRVKHSNQVASWNGSTLVQTNAGNTDAELFYWKAAPNGGGWLNLVCRANNCALTAQSGGNIICQQQSNDYGQCWTFDEMSGGLAQIRCSIDGNRVLTVNSMTYNVGERLIHHPWEGGQYQMWTRERTSEMVSSAKDALLTKDASIVSLDQQISATQQRIDWLTLALATTETVASLQTQLTAAQTTLTSARSELATKNTALLGALSPINPLSMPILATDDRDLTTSGAVLDFVNPQGRVDLLESADGTVLLSYADGQGRLRVLPYDVAQDRRNAACEQWLPEGVRACADLRNAGDKITLSQLVTLPQSGWTCEAWVQYPLATEASGQPYASNVVAAGEARNDAPIAITRGNRLGALIDGWFFDSGVDLTRTLSQGWHHVAASAGLAGVSFYLDGVPCGATSGNQPSLRFGGAADWIEVPAYSNPTAALTVSVWARSSGPTWNKSGCLVAKRDAFMMHPTQNSREVMFYVFIGGWKSVKFTPTDIQGWHLYTGTYDGTNLLLFIDGELRATLPLTGAISADATGVMIIGSDDMAISATNGPLAGDIAEVSVWSVARSASDIKQDLYRSFKGDEAGLVGYWRMSAGLDSGALKVKDLSPNARHGVVKGAPLDATLRLQRPIDVKLLGNLGAGTSPVGRLAEVRLWSLGLSADEIAVNARVTLSGNEPGLLGYFPLSEGSGQTASNRCADSTASAALTGVDWMGCTAPIGNLGGQVLSFSDRGGGFVSCAPVALANKSFTIECWSRRSGGNMGAYVGMVGGGNVNAAGKVLWFGFSNTNKLLLSFNGNDLESPAAFVDTDWHHFAASYDQPTKKMRLYCDGVFLSEKISPADFSGSATLYLGKTEVAGSFFSGSLAEVRIWDRARTDVEIRGTLLMRATGAEAGLLCCYALNAGTSSGQVSEQSSGAFVGQLQGSAQLMLATTLPLSGVDSVVVTEYSTVDVTPEGNKQALMRRGLGYVLGGVAQLLAEQRVEELTLQWVGNTQIDPTLLGYIEGAPPVPSENLTEEDDYKEATAVTLKQSESTSYRWQRSEATSQAFSMDGFVGVAWDVEVGLGVVTKAAEGRVGAAVNFEMAASQQRNSAVTTTSTLATSDSLVLTGMPEQSPAFPVLGARFVPKNVGYALVLSGMADVFVTKLKRSGRMVSYDIRPVDGVPLDVNTITFLINPAYVMNGSLDGMVGSGAADPVFYPQVPTMRAQYGSLYPASYFRLKEAYALKESINRQDKERESLFYNFQSSEQQPIGSVGGGNSATAGTGESAQKAAAEQAQQRQADINAKQQSLQGKLRAGAAFADWQVRMAGIQAKAGKHNVVNTYVWDGDGGLRTEEQSFASTVEHSISAEASIGGGAGLALETMTAGIAIDLHLMGSASKTTGTEKSLSNEKSLELTVDLSGVEKDGITDHRGNPLVPGEKVDRYRFMTFYLEGSTDHFNDFFSYVVDPEWLQSNSEEARALRQARGAKPNKTWRVLHRVTYVERPALTQGQNRDPRQNDPERQAEIIGRFNGLEKKMDVILSRLPKT